MRQLLVSSAPVGCLAMYVANRTSSCTSKTCSTVSLLELLPKLSQNHRGGLNGACCRDLPRSTFCIAVVEHGRYNNKIRIDTNVTNVISLWLSTYCRHHTQVVATPVILHSACLLSLPSSAFSHSSHHPGSPKPSTKEHTFRTYRLLHKRLGHGTLRSNKLEPCDCQTLVPEILASMAKAKNNWEINL